jgi:hypothetical protein
MQAYTDAARLVDDRKAPRLLHAARGIERRVGAGGERGERADPGLAAGRAAVDGGFTVGARARVRPARRVTALCALRLRQYAVDRVLEVGVRHWLRPRGWRAQ